MFYLCIAYLVDDIPEDAPVPCINEPVSFEQGVQILSTLFMSDDEAREKCPGEEPCVWTIWIEAKGGDIIRIMGDDERYPYRYPVHMARMDREPLNAKRVQRWRIARQVAPFGRYDSELPTEKRVLLALDDQMSTGDVGWMTTKRISSCSNVLSSGLYPVLKQLCAEQMIERKSRNTLEEYVTLLGDRREKYFYRLTPAGEDKVEQILKDAADDRRNSNGSRVVGSVMGAP